MGSSKKHKEHKDRDREKEHKRKRKHQSRSRSRSPSDRDRSERKHRKREEKERHRKRDDYYRDEAPPPPPREPRAKEERDNDLPSSSRAAAGEQEFQASLSIGEANKIRAKLGLKPLEMDGAKEDDGEEKTVLKDDIHVPAVNLAAVRKSQDLKDKLAAIREKRLINKKLGKVKTLGEESDDDDGVTSWVRKNRKQEQEKIKADKQAKMLAEMDEEFGISGLVEEEFGAAKKKAEYTARSLRGMKVEHAQDSFKEGQQIILTLKDRGVLEEDADTLVNVNIVDDEKSKKNLEVKKKKPEYKPYDEADVDEFGMMKPREMLDKYDEEIEGIKKEYFELGSGGHYDAEHERKMQQFKRQIQSKGESLELAPPRIASEFYSSSEMMKFNTVKKKVRKIRKKVAVRADDLVPLESSSNLGSRGRRRPRHDMEEGEYGADAPGGSSDQAIPGLDLVLGPDQMDEFEQEDMEVEPTPDTEILGPEEDLTGVVIEEDQAAHDLELALNKTRRLRQKPVLANPDAKVLETLKIVKKEEPDSDEDQEDKSTIVLNSTSEFCRALGEIPTYGMAGNRTEEKDDLLDFERELMEEQRRKMEEEGDDGQTGWQTVTMDTRPVDIKQLEGDQIVLDEEPLATEGLAAVLQLASKKGYLEPDNKKVVSAPKHRHLMAQNYAIEDKRYDDLDAKFQKRDRYAGGAITEFRDKDNYNPNVKLEYVDEGGRFMSQKEAFRYLSHRFHGKGSGKKKQEKKMKKIEEEQLMKSMSSTDTPLGTVALLQDKQATERTPYIILSGGKAGHSLAK